MKRCLETAQILYPGQTPIIIPEWTEMDFGAFEGHNYQELSKNPTIRDGSTAEVPCRFRRERVGKSLSAEVLPDTKKWYTT